MDFGLPLTGETLEWNLRHILSIHSSLVVCPKNEEHLVHFLQAKDEEDDTVDGMKFQHYANQFIPHVLPHALIALLTETSRENPEKTEGIDQKLSLIEEYAFLRRLLFDDFIYDQGTEGEEARNAIAIFKVYLNGQNGHKNEETEEIKRILRLTLEPFLIAYWGMAKTLLQVNFNKGLQIAF